jgi:hypothetical protein
LQSSNKDERGVIKLVDIDSPEWVVEVQKLLSSHVTTRERYLTGSQLDGRWFRSNRGEKKVAAPEKEMEGWG